MSTGQTENFCTVLVNYENQSSPNEIKNKLEGGSEREKREAMKQCVYMMLNGENMSQLFMTIVRYVLPSEDHTIQKLLLLYLEQLQKTDSTGKLLPEMILICQNLRNNLQHPNEYLRGVTLRFLCRIREMEILEPLVPSILSNLEHRHSFVRRNAASAVKAIYELAGDALLPDATEMLQGFLASEQDVSARRNALMMLCDAAPDLAVQYLLSQLDQLPSWPDTLQLVVIDLVRKVCRSTGAGEKGKYIKLVMALMSSQHTSVAYECANTLLLLSSAPSAVRAAANCYCGLLIAHSDNNVKLIVLDKLERIKDQFADIVGELVMDILRALSSPNMDIRRKTLDIVLDMLSAKNIEEVVLALKKEMVKLESKDLDASSEHRQLLIQAIHRCAMSYPDVAGTAVPVLMDFLDDANAASALDVVHFVREILETNPKLRKDIIDRMLGTFGDVRSPRVCACALWVLGEYCQSAEEVGSAMETIKEAVGPLPFFTTDDEGQVSTVLAESAASVPRSAAAQLQRPAVLSDGTYASQAAFVPAPGQPQSFTSAPSLRSFLLACDYFLGSIVAYTYTKLALKLGELGVSKQANRAKAEAMLYAVSLLRLADSGAVAQSMDDSSKQKITLCLNVLSDPSPMPEVSQALLHDCRASFADMVREKVESEDRELKAKAKTVTISQPDDLIDFHHLKDKKGMSQIELEDAVTHDLRRAMGADSLVQGASSATLDRTVQLTGFSDPLYAEAQVTVHQYDIVLDIAVTNRSGETLQNVGLELATMGDLKLVERPASQTLRAGEQAHMRANIKVSSTETGVIFGSMVFDSSTGLDQNVVILNDIHIDIMDYINPATCADAAFRSMWAEFEWENKVAVNTEIDDVEVFLKHILDSTNMKCLTPQSALSGSCGYLAANLYTRSVFGEDALVNISVESQDDGKLVGYVRIRSKTQGIALSLGDKITLKQKSLTA